MICDPRNESHGLDVYTSIDSKISGELIDGRGGSMKRKRSVTIIMILILILLPAEIFAASEVIRRGNGDERTVALTFDDGYDGKITAEVLDILQEYSVPATFFLNGEAIYKHPEVMKRVTDEGHELANHSHTHARFTELTPKELFKEVSLAEKAAKEITGKPMSRLFRVPFGAFNQEVLNLLGEAGYPYTIQWTIDPRDWEAPSPKIIHDRIMKEMVPGAIVVLHVNHQAINTPAALPMVIESLIEEGYEFVTVSEMIFGGEIGGVHVVKQGESLRSIAEEYGVSVNRLTVMNSIEDPNTIYVGQELLLPKTQKSEPKTEPKPKPENDPDTEPDPESEKDQGSNSRFVMRPEKTSRLQLTWEQILERR